MKKILSITSIVMFSIVACEPVAFAQPDCVRFTIVEPTGTFASFDDWSSMSGHTDTGETVTVTPAPTGTTITAPPGATFTEITKCNSTTPTPTPTESPTPTPTTPPTPTPEPTVTPSPTPTPTVTPEPTPSATPSPTATPPPTESPSPSPSPSFSPTPTPSTPSYLADTGVDSKTGAVYAVGLLMIGALFVLLQTITRKETDDVRNN